MVLLCPLSQTKSPDSRPSLDNGGQSGHDRQNEDRQRNPERPELLRISSIEPQLHPAFGRCQEYVFIEFEKSVTPESIVSEIQGPGFIVRLMENLPFAGEKSFGSFIPRGKEEV